MELCLFNIKDGYAEGLCRGMRSGFLTPDDYRRLGMAENLEDLRSALEDTDYGTFLQDEPSPLAVTTIAARAREKIAADFRHIRAMAGEPLGQFLDFIKTERMIDNVIGLIIGTANKKPPQELLSRCDPLGWFSEMRALASLNFSADGATELYRSLLIDTPVGPYLSQLLQQQEESAEGDAGAHRGAQGDAGADAQGPSSNIANVFSEADMDLMRTALKKAWLEDFHLFVHEVGGTTQEVMDHILKCEADFRVLAVTMNSINTSLGQISRLQDRNELYPSFGYLYPEGTDRLRKAWNEATVRSALEPFPKYASLYEQCKSFYLREGDAELLPTATSSSASASSSSSSAARGDEMKFKSLEDLLYAETVAVCERAFDQQFHYGIYYAWIKLKEQEIRNIVWIADMILMKRPEHVDQIVQIFVPKV
eukprot:GHVT01073086.1.p1 GENE.GHVT01073086.1~~GHVT01073086.1.p1  ORF type:complete len:452 (+),score=105.35 GHVT01073086.1:87-1358(+)